MSLGSTFLLIFMIGVLIFFIYMNKKHGNDKVVKSQNIEPKIERQMIPKMSQPIMREVNNGGINNYFVENQFHNDYRDVTTALLILVPERRQKFNIMNLPVRNYQPELEEIQGMVDDFVKALNKVIMDKVPTFRGQNSGWDELVVDKTSGDGWTKGQDRLGLPASLYQFPAKKNIVKLVAIQTAHKLETEDEMKFIIEMILQKKNVNDQIVLKASFIQDKRALTDENNFFSSKQVPTLVVIEDVFIVGYLSNVAMDDEVPYYGTKGEYNFDSLENNEITKTKYVEQVLNKKYRDMALEMEYRNSQLDGEVREFKREALE